MARSVTILDYGVGNLRSVARAFEECGASPVLVETPAEAARADRLVVPGVGAFGSCVSALHEAGFREVIDGFAEAGERPVLGICVGMQMFFEASHEFGRQEGLGYLAGEVRQIPQRTEAGDRRKVPHIGWAPLAPAGGADWDHTPFAAVAPGTSVYFVHSFAACPEDPAQRLADAEYAGFAVCAAVRRGNLFGVQFHPEKSGPAGLAILGAFLDL